MKKQHTGGLVFGSLAALGCEALYGLSYIFTKQATDSASPLSLLGWRFLVAFLVMTVLILVGVIHIDLKGKKIRPLLLVAIFDPVLYFIGETFGISHTTASESGVFLACIPSRRFTGIRFNPAQISNTPAGDRHLDHLSRGDCDGASRWR